MNATIIHQGRVSTVAPAEATPDALWLETILEAIREPGAPQFYRQVELVNAPQIQQR